MLIKRPEMVAVVTVKFRSASLNRLFRHKCVISLGTAKICVFQGCAILSSLYISMTTSMAGPWPWVFSPSLLPLDVPFSRPLTPAVSLPLTRLWTRVGPYQISHIHPFSVTYIHISHHIKALFVPNANSLDGRAEDVLFHAAIPLPESNFAVAYVVVPLYIAVCFATLAFLCNTWPPTSSVLHTSKSVL